MSNLSSPQINPAKWPPRVGSDRFPDASDEMHLRELDWCVTLLADSIDVIVQAIQAPQATIKPWEVKPVKPTPAKRIENLIYNIGVTKRRLQILRRSAQKAPYVEPTWGKIMGRPVEVIADKSASIGNGLDAQAAES